MKYRQNKRAAKVKIMLVLFVCLLVALAIIIVVAKTKRRMATKTVPMQTAYSDGFSVAIIAETAGEKPTVKRATLNDANEMIKQAEWTSFMIPRAHIQHIEKKLHDLLAVASNSVYPHIYINISEDSERSQIIEISTHFEKTTYFHCYLATPTTVHPIWSSSETEKEYVIVQYQDDNSEHNKKP